MDEQKDLKQQETSQFKERVEKDVETLSTPEILKSTLDKIQTTVGVEGFDFLSNIIEGIENMNPDKKARKKIFLTENTRKQDRKDLKNRLKLWVEILSTEKDLYSMVESCEKDFEESKKLYEENLAHAVEDVKDLEQAYRTIYLFYRNTEESKTNYISIMNASLEQLTDPNTIGFANTIEAELNSK